MAVRRKKRVKKKSPKRFRFQLSLTGVAGVGIVSFCLFLWMFLLGIWAGQTILLPSATVSRSVVASQVDHNISVGVIQPERKKRAVGR